MRILLSEDEASLARAIVTILRKHNYEADAVRDGLCGLGFTVEDTPQGAKVSYNC